MNFYWEQRSDYDWELYEYQNTHRNVRYNYTVIPIQAEIDVQQSTDAYKEKMEIWMEKISFKKSMKKVVLKHIQRLHKNKNEIAARYPIFTELRAITEEVRENGEIWADYCTQRNRVFTGNYEMGQEVWRDSSYKNRNGEEKTPFLRTLIRCVHLGIHTEEQAEEGFKHKLDYDEPPRLKELKDTEDNVKGDIELDPPTRYVAHPNDTRPIKFVPAE